MPTERTIETGVDGLVERLRFKARTASEISRRMAESKSLWQDGNTERRTDLYAWSTPEQMTEWKAADALLALKAEVEELQTAMGARDRFLVQRDLWTDFVNQLSQAILSGESVK